ncbi:MAG: DUF2845 domain-containing protein [Candidatus Omnitrophota bacterium]|nr:MAG: DUF2845 domain-containing protein [Candidatus Omnitrophota bacterium]
MKRLICLFIMLIVLSGCATTSVITPKLALGMTKEEVLKKCGRPLRSGAMRGEKGEVLETFVYEETLFRQGQAWITTYVYFQDNEVIYYGAEPIVSEYETVEK